MLTIVLLPVVFKRCLQVCKDSVLRDSASETRELATRKMGKEREEEEY